MTVETEVNGDLKSTNERGPFLVGKLGLVCRISKIDFCSALAALVGLVQNIFFLTVHYFNSFVPIAKRAGQAAVQGRLSLTTYLWSTLTRYSLLLYASYLWFGQRGLKRRLSMPSAYSLP
jgi:hypothetical protein